MRRAACPAGPRPNRHPLPEGLPPGFSPSIFTGTARHSHPIRAMNPNDSQKRVYTEKEVGEIIRRAVERQEADRRTRTEDGLTREEIERLAAEVGIDVRYVQAAMAEVETSPADRHFPLLGGPLKAERVRMIPGTLTDAAIAEIAQEIRKTFRYRGSLEVVGSSFDWISLPNSGEDVFIEARPEDGKTRLYLRQKFHSWAFLSYFFLFIPTLISLAFLLKGESTAFYVMMGLIGVLLVAAHMGYRMATRRRIRRLDDLMRRMEAAATRSHEAEQPTAEKAASEKVAGETAAPETTPAPPLDLPDEPLPESPRQARRRVR